MQKNHIIIDSKTCIIHPAYYDTLHIHYFMKWPSQHCLNGYRMTSPDRKHCILFSWCFLSNFGS